MKSKRSDKGTHNVLVDLGLEDAEELTAKALLAAAASGSNRPYGEVACGLLKARFALFAGCGAYASQPSAACPKRSAATIACEMSPAVSGRSK